MDKKLPKVNLTSSNLSEEKLSNLYRILPEAFSENKIDFEKLRTVLGDEVSLGPEKFSFSWAGKSNAIKNVLVPSRLTLNPEPKQSIKWDESENLFIEGDNLEVLKLLQKAYFEKIKMIYIDPPYNTGHDFVYNDDFSSPLDNYLKQTGQKNDGGDSTTTNKETNGRYHSDWLSMMYPRLKLAWNLLREDGVIFVSIDNDECHRLRMVMDEIFGEENFVEAVVWNKRIPKNDKGIGNIHEYILIYAKDSNHKHEFIMSKEGLQDIDDLLTKLKSKKVSIPEAEEEVKKLYKKKGYDRGITLYNSLDENYRLWGKINMSWPNANTFGERYEVLHPKTKRPVKVPDRGWRWIEESFNDAAGIVDGEYTNIKELHDGTFLCNRIWFDKDEKIQPSSVNYLEEVETFLLRSVISLKSDGGIEVEKVFDGKSYFSYPKPTSLIQILLSAFSIEENDIVLDFFAGSGTTAHAILKLNAEDGKNRKFIVVQLPEKLDKKTEGSKAGYKTISDIAKERIRRVIKGYGNEPHPIDAGFKVFTLAESNYPENNFVLDPEKSQDENQEAFIAYLNNAKQKQLFNKDDDMSLVYENIVKEGLSLNSKIEKFSIGKNNVYQVTDDDQQLLICLENILASETVKELTDKSHKDEVFICLESSLDDTTAANLSLNLDLKTI